MSSDSGSDSGSSSSSYSGYDEAGISTPTTSYESIGTTGYDEAGTTTPSYAFDSINTTGYDPSYTYQPTTEQLGSPVYTDTGTYDEAALSQPSTITDQQILELQVLTLMDSLFHHKIPSQVLHKI
jgi:hypothetical protein